METETVRLIVSFLSGGALGSIITHKCTLARERRNRRRDFTGFLGSWLVDIQRVRYGDAASTYTAYLAKVSDFGGQATMIEKDFWRKQKFKQMCTPPLTSKRRSARRHCRGLPRRCG